MATELEIENFLTLFGLKRAKHPGIMGSRGAWNVYKGDAVIAVWAFDEPINAYVQAIKIMGLT